MNAERLRQHFSYDPQTGAFTRLDHSRMRRPHVGTSNRRKDTAYAVLCIDGKRSTRTAPHGCWCTATSLTAW